MCAAASLQRELKQVDDKALQAELHLIESKTFYALGNVQKARGSLTAARTATSGIYTPPRLQADFDMQSGAARVENSHVLHTVK